MSFGRKSVHLVKVWILVEGSRWEVVITFGDFPSVQGPCESVVLSTSICEFEPYNTLPFLNTYVL